MKRMVKEHQVSGREAICSLIFPMGSGHLGFQWTIRGTQLRINDQCLARVGTHTDNETFEGFMFSPDGKKLVFASNRNAKSRGETNVFIADWVD